MTVQFPRAVYWKGYLLPIAYSYLLSCKSINHFCVVLFLGFLFCPTDLCLCFYVNTILFDGYNSVKSFEIKEHDYSRFVLLSQDCFGYWCISSMPTCWEFFVFVFLNHMDSLPLSHQGSPLYIFCCCCSVVQACSTLCDLMYCSMPIYIFRYSYSGCINIEK